MIELKPETRAALKKLLEIDGERNACREKWIELKRQQDELTFEEKYVQKQKPKNEDGKYSSQNTLGGFENTEKYKKLLAEIRKAGKDEDEAYKRYEEQLGVVGRTFLREYGLLNKHARVVDKISKESKKVYHITGVFARDINQIHQTLIAGEMHPGRLATNAAGIAMYWGDKNFFVGLEDRPEEAIEASISSSVNVHEVSLEEYNDHKLDSYKPYFCEEDFNLLSDLEYAGAMHVRSIFDVAMGFDACFRVNPETGIQVWAIYDRSILEVERMPIRKFDDIFSKSERERKI